MALHVMNADGSNVQKITDLGSVREAAWSPDGTRLVVSSWTAQTGNVDLYVVNADGYGTPKRITAHAWDDQDPSWSPDGSKIAFERHDPDTIYDPYVIYLIDPEGKNEERLTAEGMDESDPDWSPDGRMTFIRYHPIGKIVQGEVYIRGTGGQGPFRLTFTDNSESNPVFSPNGSKIAYDTGFTMYVMKNSGAGKTLLPSIAERNGEISGQPVLSFLKCGEEQARKAAFATVTRILPDQREVHAAVARIEGIISSIVETATDSVPESIANDANGVVSANGRGAEVAETAVPLEC